MFQLILPTVPEVPIIISVPHAGTCFPEDIKSEFVPELQQKPDDTDWFVHQLYDFAPTMGITLLVATHSRWVIDLNRDPHQQPLYNDGRILTALCPTTTFLGQSIYKNARQVVAKDEVERRKALYFNPYHQKLSELMAEKKMRFGKVLLWDAHSIRQHVPTIHATPFPDLILGDADGRSSDSTFSKLVLKHLSATSKIISYNKPFQGGYITRQYGRPSEQQHALQLEMTKVNYMNNSEQDYDATRADVVKKILIRIFENLSHNLS